MCSSRAHHFNHGLKEVGELLFAELVDPHYSVGYSNARRRCIRGVVVIAQFKKPFSHAVDLPLFKIGQRGLYFPTIAA